MEFYKAATQLSLIVIAVVLIEKGFCGPGKRRKPKNTLKAPVVYNNLPAGTAVL